jgi:hypothetical protein
MTPDSMLWFAAGVVVGVFVVSAVTIWADGV